jgi:hypothetical protein
MDHINKCTSTLRPLLAKGATNEIPLAHDAIDELLEATPKVRQKTALSDIRTAVQEHRDTAEGFQRGFADRVNDYIENLMKALE